VHAHEESANSRAASLSLLEAGLATREEEAHHHELGLHHQEEQLFALEDRLNREWEVLQTRENMVSQTTVNLTQRQKAL
jgi:cell division protein FtsL